MKTESEVKKTTKVRQKSKERNEICYVQKLTYV